MRTWFLALVLCVGCGDSQSDSSPSTVPDGGPAQAQPYRQPWDAGLGIPCGGNTCTAPGQVCCLADGGAVCVPKGTCAPPTFSVGCDGPEDCSNGDLCCGIGNGVGCRPSGSCSNMVCRTKADCPQKSVECEKEQTDKPAICVPIE